VWRHPLFRSAPAGQLPGAVQQGRRTVRTISVVRKGEGMSTSDRAAESEKAKFDEVMDTEEQTRPNRREHAKADPRPDDDELERRTEIERSEVGLPEEDDS